MYCYLIELFPLFCIYLSQKVFMFLKTPYLALDFHYSQLLISVALQYLLGSSSCTCHKKHKLYMLWQLGVFVYFAFKGLWTSYSPCGWKLYSLHKSLWWVLVVVLQYSGFLSHQSAHNLMTVFIFSLMNSSHKPTCFIAKSIWLWGIVTPHINCSGCVHSFSC